MSKISPFPKKIKFQLIKTPSMSVMDEKRPYTVRMDSFRTARGLHWFFYAYGPNGKRIMTGKDYLNKAQCRNIGKKFAELCFLKWIE